MRSLAAAVPSTFSDVRSAALVVTKTFAFQSYFDSYLLEKALLPQPPNASIVPSTVTESQIQCYGAGLHPSSQTPCAVQFLGADGLPTSPVYVLTPGQTIIPVGSKGRYAGVRFGLPYGWLGGGLVNLVVFQTPEANVGWTGGAEVIFHRARFAIVKPADLGNEAPKNWPMRFPWTQAVRGADAIPQKGQPMIAITEPTRILAVLRPAIGVSSGGFNATTRMVLQGTADFSGQVGLDTIETNIGQIFYDIIWPAWSNFGAGVDLASQCPMVEITGGITRLAADDGGLVFVDTTEGAMINETFIDVVRYGKL